MITVTDVDKPAEPRKKRATDPTLALANRIDRALSELPDYGVEMILNYLSAKYRLSNPKKGTV